MSATIVRLEPRGSALHELGLRAARLGQLQYLLPASGGKTRDVFSCDGDLVAVVGGTPGEHVQGRCCITVHGARVFGILPADGGDYPVCFSVPTAELTVSTEGSQGLLRKRPTLIGLHAAGFEMKLSDVDKLLLALEKYQAGQEAALLGALAK